VTIWATNESCVRDLKTFRAMPWSSKLMYLSFVLVSLGFTWVAYLSRTDGRDDARFWGWAAVLCWIGYALEIPTYVRGHYAERRGVPPAPSGKRPNFEFMKRSMILLGSLTCLLTILILISSIHHPVYNAREGWTFVILGIAFFFQQLSTYTRSRYWDIALE